MSDQQTTGERLIDINRLVRYVLWNIAADPDQDREFTDEQRTAIATHAQNLFKSTSWCADITGRYAVLPANFLEALDEGLPALLDELTRPPSPVCPFCNSDHTDSRDRAKCKAAWLEEFPGGIDAATWGLS